MNKRWTVILAFCGVFVAGAVVGGIVVRRGGPPPAVPEPHRGPPSSGPDLDRFTPVIMRRYTARLELDDVQRDQLQDIVVDAEGELRALRNRSFQETIAIGDRMNAQVALLLRPDQHERFEKLKESVRNYWERERERRNGNTNAPPRSDDERKSEKSEKRDEPKKPAKSDKRDDKREDARKSEKSEKQEKSDKSDKSEKQQKRDEPRKPEKEKR